MALTGQRVKGLESAVSAFLLAILLLIAVGIFVKQSDFDMARFGIITTAPAAASLQQTETDKDAKPALSSLAPEGFEPFSKTESYKSENLYEKINGKAPFYIEAGFEELTAQRFANKNDQSQWMEVYVYNMGGVRNAFSVYSIQRRAEAEPFKPVRFAYKTPNALYFVYGKYYVEMVGSAESQELFGAIAEAARKIRAKLVVDSDTEIDELALFPQENILPDTMKLYLTNAFGFEELNNTFAARYQTAEGTVTVFLSRRADGGEADTLAESYRKFLIQNGAKEKNSDLKMLEGKVMDFYDTTEIVLTAGEFVVGIHEADSQQAAEQAAEALINKLNSITANE
jgi:hypothetical protein